jgi:hypothetical protein
MGHQHPHDHGHPHSHDEVEPSDVIDAGVPDEELSPSALSRRNLLRGAGLLGTSAAAAASVLAAPSTALADTGNAKSADRRAGYLWLAGDHHIHTQHSSDAIYRVIDQVRHGRAYGLDWMVITDHGGATHARIGVDKVNPDIRAARDEVREMLVYQGLEWNIPGAEHATVFVHPGRNEVSVLKQFENDYDGSVKGASDSTPANEALAIAGLTFLATQVDKGRVDDALFLANHPARRGVDSPHEIRNWRDAAPGIAIGFEGAPGHQAAGIKEPNGGGGGRGFYEGSPSANSFPGYPLESYRTWGGFDWMTSTVGGLWDSLLAEGKQWSVSANSDCHFVWADTAERGPNSDFNANGRYNDPVHNGTINLQAGDYWPGFYSRTNVGASRASYAAVMSGLRAGRVWVDHGHLIDGIDVQVRRAGHGPSGATLGGVLRVKRGAAIELAVTIDLAHQPNWAQFVPRLARVDVIRGDVTGKAADRDTFSAPTARVASSFEVPAGGKRFSFKLSLGKVEKSGYVRLRGTDGNRSQPGLNGPSVDPHGPALDVVGDADPWRDLWFYTNPVWVVVD